MDSGVELRLDTLFRETLRFEGTDMPVALIISLWFTAAAAYLTHLVWAVSTLMSEHAATAGQIVLSIAGTLLPPLGLLHGVVLWFS